MKQLVLLLSLCVCTLSFSQEKERLSKVPLTKIKPSLQRANIQSILVSELKATPGTEFRIEKINQDKFKNSHSTYQQYYNGIKVIYGQIKVHQANGIATSYNGAYYKANGVNTAPSVSRQLIIASAKTYMGDDMYWFSNGEFSNVPPASMDLALLPNRTNNTINLVYEMSVGTTGKEPKIGTLYIDATSGNVIKFKNGVFNCFNDHSDVSHKKSHTETAMALPLVTGSGYAAYTGAVNFETKLESSDYILNDETRATSGYWNLSTQGLGSKTGIITVDMREGTDYVNGPMYEFTDSNNNWTAAEMITDDNVYAIDAHWGTELIYDYWKNEQSWNSYNGSSSPILSLIHYDNDWTNASWASVNSTTGFMIYGDGAGSYSPLTTLDVVAHEIAHGINNATSNLDYELESGALNEGLSDIWAMVIENYANDNHGTSTDPSRINDQNVGGALRSFSDPNSYGQPDTYGGTYWYDVTGCTPNGDATSGTYNDYCGVHTNSGVLNYWFWLLYNGGTGTNDIGNNFSVTAIDVYDAAAIVWQMQTNYMTSTSDYADARDGAIQAAIDLFGDCSQQEQSVTNAFHAVGVGEAYVFGAAPIIATQPTNTTIETNTSGQLSVTASNYTSVSWEYSDDQGDGWHTATDGSNFSGSTTTTLTILNLPEFEQGYWFRAILANDCGGSVTSNTATVYVLSYTSIPDSNFEDALEALGYDDISDDGKVPTYIIEDVTSLDVSDQSISDLTGIEAFTDLLDLDIRDNNLSAVDISNNVLLTSFNAQDNNLTALDLSSNTAIQTLGLARNSLTDLDLSNNTQLSKLYAASNSITSLDLSNNPNLTIVGVNPNNLSSLNIQNGNNAAITTFAATGNPNLTCILVDDADYSTTNWTIVDAQTSFSNESCYTAYTAIPDDNFEAALGALGYDDIAEDNQVPTALIENLTTLAFGENSIADLTGIEDFTSLTTLDLYQIGLPSIDLSSNLTLQTLRLNENPLTELDVSMLTNLTELNVLGTDIISLDVSSNTALTFFDASQNDSLTTLNIKNGNNSNFSLFNTLGTPNLTCILVDDANYSSTNWTDIDSQTSFSDTYCRYTAIPDANFEAALEALGYDDIADDNQVPTALIENVTTLDVSLKGISDLTGIEDFSALTNLNTFFNSLNTIDLSQNTALESLNLSQNPFNSLDVSTNTNLKTLVCEACGLDDLDVSSNLLLETIVVNGNSMTSLDITNNTNLISLNIRNNELTAINVSNNLDLEYLNIKFNQLTAIDLSNNSNLLIFNSAVNNLSSIDLSNNVLLEEIDLEENSITSIDFSNNLELNNIDLTTNNITQIDLSNQSKLAELYLGDNPITALDLSNNPLLIDVSLFDCALENLNLASGGNTNVQVMEITNNPNLTCVVVDDASYSTTNWTNIDSQTSFSDTYCRYTAIPDANFEAALGALGYDDITDDNQVPTALIENVTTLDVSFKSISDLTGIEDFSALTDLNTFFNSLNTIDLSQNTALESLNLSQNPFDSLNVSNNTNLKTLVCQGCGLDDLDVSSNLLLETIEVDNNSMTSFDVTNNTNLISLNIKKNELTAIDVSNNLVLEYLNIKFNQLTAIDLSNNSNLLIFYSAVNNLTSIDLSNNVLLEGIDLSNIVLLEEIDTATNSITSIDFSNNPELTYIDLSNNNITQIDLSNQSKLAELYLENNPITDLDLSNNPLLIDVSLFDCALENLNLASGGNTNVQVMEITNNPNLTCVVVDDASYSTTNWTNIDSQTSFSDTYCRYTAIPDANFEAALGALGYDDIADDNQVPTALIEGVTELNVSTQGILDLTGIEDFTALLDLDIRDNSISALDVSSNVLLTTLLVQDNNLTAIEVSDNLNLEFLGIARNSISSLDVSLNSQLTHLLAVDNTITSVDLSNNPNIEKIGLDDNALVSLNIQNGNNANITLFVIDGNPDLTCVLVDDVTYSTTNWTDIDSQTSFSDTYCRYTAIPDANFEAALGALGYDDISEDNQVPTALIENVTTLDVSIQQISDLTGIEDFSALTNLNTFLNYLNTIDLSQNTALESLDLSHNSFDSLDVSTNTNLKTLVCQTCGLDDLDVSNNLLLETIEVDNNSMTSLDITNNTNLISLNIKKNELTAINVSNNLVLEYLNIDFNQLTAIDLSNNSNLLIFYSAVNNLSSIDLSNNVLLEKMDLDENSITSIDFSNNLELNYIDLSNNNISQIDLSNQSKLAELYLENNPITALDLSNNPLLIDVTLNDCALENLNLASGENTNIQGINITNNPNLTCILVDDASYSTTNWTDIDAQTSFSETSCTTDYTLAIDVFLQGALLNPNAGEETLMRDDVRVGGYIPTTSPYTDAITCDITVFDDGGTTGIGAIDDNIVDWVWVELRDATDNTLIIESRSALLQRDGDIVEVDGISDLIFSLDSDSYFVAVKHRNHLGVMTSNAVGLSTTTTVIDFTNMTGSELYDDGTIYDGNEQVTENGIECLFAGDANGDGNIGYNNATSDINTIQLDALLHPDNTTFNAGFSSGFGYFNSDINMDGKVSYSASESDLNQLQLFVLLYPLNTTYNIGYDFIQEQLPQ
ncbi:MAG: M4 family metallopeptidase [Flavobacteriaceae bacterium]